MTVPLTRLRIGQTGCIMAIRSARPAYVRKLQSLTVLPGCRIRVCRLEPVIVIQVGETELAMDHQAGQEILVRPDRVVDACGTDSRSRDVLP